MPLTMVSSLNPSFFANTYIEILHSHQPSFRLWVQCPRSSPLCIVIVSTSMFQLDFFIKLKIDLVPLELGPASFILHKPLPLLPKLLHSSSHPHPTRE